MGLGPRHRHQFGPTIRIFEPGHLRHDERLKLHRIQVSPTALLVTVNVQSLLGFRIGPHRLRTLDLHFHTLRLEVHPHFLNFPRRLHSKSLREEIFFIHRLSLTPPPLPSATASSFYKIPAELNITGFCKRKLLPPRARSQATLFFTRNSQKSQ